MFIFDILSGRMNSPNLLSAIDLNTPCYRTRGSMFLRIGFHCTNYRVHEPMYVTMRELNKEICLFNLILTRYQFMNRLKLTLYTYCCVVHGPSYELSYSVGVIVASSTHCRDRNYPVLVF
jgi:hypothetical protein